MEQEIRLNRSGQRPLAFMGVEVAGATTKHKQRTRWRTVRFPELTTAMLRT
jgi:hypothetical protein